MGRSRDLVWVWASCCTEQVNPGPAEWHGPSATPSSFLNDNDATMSEGDGHCRLSESSCQALAKSSFLPNTLSEDY